MTFSDSPLAFTIVDSLPWRVGPPSMYRSTVSPSWGPASSHVAGGGPPLRVGAVDRGHLEGIAPESVESVRRVHDQLARIEDLADRLVFVSRESPVPRLHPSCDRPHSPPGLRC